MTYQIAEVATEWLSVGPVSAFPENGGACVKIGSKQVAVFNFARRGTWYACQNLCPHRRELVLSRGMIGSAGDVPKVACPLHKSTFSLEDGTCLSADLEAIRTYPVKVIDGFVHVRMDPRP